LWFPRLLLASRKENGDWCCRDEVLRVSGVCHSQYPHNALNARCCDRKKKNCARQKL
jgi:hypothetical protein